MRTKLLCMSLLMLMTVPAVADVEINETNFPDQYFREWLTRQTYGADGVLTDEEIAGVKTMRVYNISSMKKIYSLQGIEFFTALTGLDCEHLELTELDLSKNTNLTSLSCYNNHLTELDLSKNILLEFLNCNDNQFSSLDVSMCPMLKGISCYNNRLTALDVTHNPELEVLDCSGNMLTELNVTNNTKLYRLAFENNQIASVDVSKMSNLTYLEVANNQLTELDVSANGHLYAISCGNNLLTSIDVKNNRDLQSLACSYNQLTSLDVTKNKSLMSLGCAGNKLTSLDLTKNPILTNIDVSDNLLTTLDLSGMPDKWTLHVYLQLNQISGAGMDALVRSLPTREWKKFSTEAYLHVVWNEGEQNVITAAQVAAAKAKNWVTQYYDGQKWQDYAGIDAAGIERMAADRKADTSGRWYDLHGRRMEGNPDKGGVYIHDGRKVVVK